MSNRRVSLASRVGIGLAAIAIGLGADTFKPIVKPVGAAAPERVYTLVVCPWLAPREMLKRFGPLARMLGSKTGLHVQLVVPATYEDHLSKVQAGKADFCYQNPIIFAKCRDSLKYIGTGIEAGESRFRGLIITRADSGITAVDQLKGKTVSIVSRESAGGYYSPAITCKMNGIDVERDCKVLVATGTKQENVILDVFNKRVDAGFIRESVLHKVDESINAADIKVLAECEYLPFWAFAAGQQIPDELVQRVSDIILNLSADAPEMKAAGLDGFIKGNSEEYNALRQLLVTGQK